MAFFRPRSPVDFGDESFLLHKISKICIDFSKVKVYKKNISDTFRNRNIYKEVIL